MSDKNPPEEREDGDEEKGGDALVPTQSSHDEQTPSEVAGSPVGSQASRSSSSRRDNRVVELLHDVDASDNSHHPDENWMIRADFYDEDVAADLDEDQFMSDEEDRSEVESEVGREFVDRNDGNVSDSESDGDVDGEPNFDELIEMGFVVADELSSSSSDESHDMNDEANAAPNRANYDATLPATHRYLGDNLEESRGRKFLVEGSSTVIPLFNLRNIVLLPGQILPITTANSNPRIHSHLTACINNGSTLIGIMSDPRDCAIGTTAEVRNYSNQNDELRIIMEGRQRFKLLSSPFETTIEGSVKILPEVSLGRPYPKIPSWLRFSTDQGTPERFIVSKHPAWIVKQYEAHFMMKKIVKQIENWFNGEPTKDTNDFSYWVAANLPMSNFERMKVLAFDCTEARLAYLSDMLEKSDFFGCSACKNVICHKKDVFPMSCSGPQNSFVNANGFVHDTLTVRRARGLMQEQHWSTEFSWFPGYAWRIACCELCGRHIGWGYKSTTADTKPKRFYGLSRANVRLQGNQTPVLEIPPYHIQL